jgi:fatty-acyl-CoA synthase
MPKSSPYEHGLEKNAANYAPLSPISLIARTAYTYPQQLAVVHGDRRLTWEETYARSRRLASALTGAGVGPGETVAVMAANTPEMVEAHFGVKRSHSCSATAKRRCC